MTATNWAQAAWDEMYELIVPPTLLDTVADGAPYTHASDFDHIRQFGVQGADDCYLASIGRLALIDFTLAGLEDWMPYCSDIEQAAARIHAVICSKQADYGHGNITAFGIAGVIVRLSDKIERLKHIRANGKQPSNEPLRDTLLDIVGYVVVARMLLRGTFMLELDGGVSGVGFAQAAIANQPIEDETVPEMPSWLDESVEGCFVDAPFEVFNPLLGYGEKLDVEDCCPAPVPELGPTTLQRAARVLALAVEEQLDEMREFLDTERDGRWRHGETLTGFNNRLQTIEARLRCGVNF